MKHTAYLFLTFLTLAVQPLFSIESKEAQQIGYRIWRNECGAKIDGLLHWNQNEEFASLGIGHFIWYPEGTSGPYEEQFPALVDYLKKHDVTVPEWLSEAKGCPWKNKKVFDESKYNTRETDLKLFLAETIDMQIAFMVERLHQFLPQMLANVVESKHNLIKNHFHHILNHPKGSYLLLDYINFKGTGISPSERYQGQGWGIIQVFEEMSSDQDADPIEEFIGAAKRVLYLRTENAPIERQEKKWLKGWFNRIETYRQ